MAEALPDFNGTWLLQRVDGEAEALLVDSGIPWPMRRAAKAMKYGAGRFTQEIRCTDGCVVVTSKGGPVTTTMEVSIGAGEQRTSGLDGSQVMARARWEGRALIVDSWKLDGTVLPTLRRYMDGQEMILEAATSKGAMRRIFTKVLVPGSSDSVAAGETAPSTALLSESGQQHQASQQRLDGAAAASDAGDALRRFSSAVEAPWQHADYSRRDLVQWLSFEREQVENLFKNPLTPSMEIPRSILPRPIASLTFKGVSFSAHKPDGSSQLILEEVSGHFEGGDLVALMGPSGCGKSTLLDCLADKKTARYGGEILLNGRPRDHLFRRIAAYVGQEDVMPQHWTVREAVEFNFKLKSPGLSNLPKELDERCLDVLLSAFGLTGVSGTYIGGSKVRGCSGGQRRRVTLARGVAQRAAILFADEPTSGLSATDAELCIKALRIISKKLCCLIFVVIHQPRVEVANLFDKLILLTAHPGRMIYSGRMEDALAYWSDCGHPVPRFANPADFYLDLVTPGGPMDHADEFAEAFRVRLLPGIAEDVDRRRQQRGLSVAEMLRVHNQAQAEALMGPQPFRQTAFTVSFPGQVAHLFRRKIRITRRNPSAIGLPVVAPVFLAVFMGLMYTGIGTKPLQSQMSFVFLLLMRICMGGMQNMPQLIEDRTIMKYEISESLYTPQAFILVGFAVDISLSLLGAVLNVTIMYAFSGLSWKYFGLLMGWALMNFMVFDSFFALLAAVAPNVQTAQVAAIPFQSIFMMFSGFVLSRSSAPSFLTWVFEISPLNYAIQSIFCRMAEDHGAEGTHLLHLFGFEPGQAGKGVAIILAMSVCFRVAQVVGLKYTNNIQR